jgi:cell wall-associated NlpC family hydrolase
MVYFADLIGVPFVEFGRDTEKGLDCYGLCIEVLKRQGIHLNDVVLEKFDREKVVKYLPKLNVKKTDKIKENAILEFYEKGTNRLHVAIALNEKLFLHATENQGVRISNIETARHYMTLTNIYEVENGDN